MMGRIIIDAETKKAISRLTLESQFEESFRDIEGKPIEDTDYDYSNMFQAYIESLLDDERIECVNADAFVFEDGEFSTLMEINEKMIL